MIRVEIYGKRDCCLCDEAKATLLRVQREIPFALHEIDIESTPELYEIYRERIPLILITSDWPSSSESANAPCAAVSRAKARE